MSKLGFKVGALLGALLGLIGCSSVPPETTEATPEVKTHQVVVTTSILCDLVDRIAENTIHLDCLMKPGEDPHAFQLQPADRKRLENAQLILYGGYNLEANLIPLIQSLKTPSPKIAVYEIAVPQPLMAKSHDHNHGTDPHSETDSDHPEEAATEVPDPHVWLDVKQGIQILNVIETQLQQFNPQSTDIYRRNTQTLTEELQQLHTWIQTQIDTIPAPQRLLITTHDAFSYYANAYGLKVSGVLQGISTLEQPTPQAISELSQTVTETQVPTIFVETTVNPKLMETVSREAKVKLSPEKLYSGSLGVPGSGAETYEGMMKMNTCAIVNGLGGRCKN